MTKSNKDKFYFDEEGFCSALSSYQQQMADPALSGSAEVPEIIITELSTLSDKLMLNHKFYKYPKELKEDMQMHFWEKIMRALILFDFSKGCKAFSYFTRTHFLANLDILGKHYKYQNLKKKLTEEYCRKFGLTEKQIKEMCGEYVSQDICDE